MTRGRLGPHQLPLIPITLHGTKDQEIEALLDTAFSGKLSLSHRHRSLFPRRRPVASEDVELADGSVTREALYEVEVTFDGVRRLVLASFVRSDDSLVGVGLLKGKRLTVDFHTGEVVVGHAATPTKTP